MTKYACAAAVLLLAASAAPAAVDVGIAGILQPRADWPCTRVRPTAQVVNAGPTAVTDIGVSCRVSLGSDTLYRYELTLPGPVQPGERVLAVCTEWTPPGPGTYRSSFIVSHPADTNPANDIARAMSEVFDHWTPDTLLAPWWGYTPVIDGVIGRTEYPANEWSPPEDISDVYGRAGVVPQEPGSVLFHIANGRSRVYMAVDLREVTTREDGDMVVVYVDENHDLRFIATDSIEGAHFIFTRGGADSVVYSQRPGEQCPGCVSASSVAGGNLQFEFSIPIGTRPGDYDFDYSGDQVGMAVSAWRATGERLAWWPPSLTLPGWTDPVHYGLCRWLWVGVEEPRPAPEAASSLIPTILRNVFNLQSPISNPQSPMVLVDACGRRVLDLHAGLNDISHLSPGVYFVLTPSPQPSPFKGEGADGRTWAEGSRGRGFEGSSRKVVIQR